MTMPLLFLATWTVCHLFEFKTCGSTALTAFIFTVLSNGAEYERKK